jgi:hypothetical protein
VGYPQVSIIQLHPDFFMAQRECNEATVLGSSQAMFCQGCCQTGHLPGIDLEDQAAKMLSRLGVSCHRSKHVFLVEI